MAWENPGNQIVGTLITATLWNDLVDSIQYLLDPDADTVLHNNAANYVSNSAVFVNVDAVNLNQAITTNGGPVRVDFVGCGYHTAFPGDIMFDILVDAARYGAVFANGLHHVDMESAGPRVHDLGFSLSIPGLAAGAHTFALQWRNTIGANMTLLSAAATNGVYFSAIEGT